LPGSRDRRPIVLAVWKTGPPKEQIESYRHVDGNRIEMAQTRVSTDGSSNTYTLSWPVQGGTVLGETGGTVMVETVIAPGDWVVTTLQDGKQLRTLHKVISRDGKTMTHTSRGTDPQGRPFENVTVFDRQP
jgi:hypothetical protein